MQSSHENYLNQQIKILENLKERNPIIQKILATKIESLNAIRPENPDPEAIDKVISLFPNNDERGILWTLINTGIYHHLKLQIKYQRQESKLTDYIPTPIKRILASLLSPSFIDIEYRNNEDMLTNEQLIIFFCNMSKISNQRIDREYIIRIILNRYNPGYQSSSEKEVVSLLQSETDIDDNWRLLISYATNYKQNNGEELYVLIYRIFFSHCFKIQNFYTFFGENLPTSNNDVNTVLKETFARLTLV